MKSYKVLEKNLEKCKVKASELKNELNSIWETYPKYESFKERLEKQSDFEKWHNENDLIINDISTDIMNEEIKKQLLKQNYHVAILNYLKPIICEVWNKYENKKLGEKTKRKIENEFFEKTNFRIYIYKDYSSYFKSYDYKISFGLDNSEKILIDNTIQKIEPDKLILFFESNDYIENINKAIKDIRINHTKIIKAKNDLKVAMDNYNKLAYQGIEQINFNDLSRLTNEIAINRGV